MLAFPCLYLREVINLAEGKVGRYKCKICGYVYDPSLGDSDSGVPPGTPFEELPDDWVCPVCGADKKEFVEVS